MNIHEVVKVCRRSPRARLEYSESFFYRPEIHKKKSKLERSLGGANVEVRPLYKEIKVFSEIFLFDRRDAQFWLHIQKQLADE